MSSSLAAGVIGPYRIVRTVGSGGWSTVYEVAAGDGTRLALKRLAADLAPPALARFRREVESLRRIDHPGVLRLIDAGVDGTSPYLVTPLVEGTSVRALFARGAVGVEGAIAVVLGAAEAVAAIHAAGLVHRDLKPENLMLTARGDVIVIDLGLALGPEHSRHTAEDALTGSVPYMSPEQIDDRAPSAASDVWALGVVLYEAIAGRRPFERPRQSEEVAAILAGRFAPLTDAACPDELARLISACLSPSPAQRPRDGAALAAALLPLVDWTSPSRLAAERNLLLFDPSAFAASIRTVRVALAARAAEAALQAADTFAATRALDRGLRYAPDAPELLALLDRLMSAPAPAGAPAARAMADLRATVRGHAPPPMPAGSPLVSGPSAARSDAPAGIASHHHRAPVVVDALHASQPLTPSANLVALPASAAPRSRRHLWIAVGAAVAVLAAVVAGLMTSGGEPPRAVAPPPAAATGYTAEEQRQLEAALGVLPTESIPEPAPTVSRPAHVRPSRPAHVRPSQAAPGRPPVAPDQP